MIVIRFLLLVVFLLLVPMLLGIPWTTLLPKRNRCRLCACFPMGFFVELAIFQLLEVPVAFLHLPFTLLCWAFMTVLAIACVCSFVVYIRNRPFEIKVPALSRWELFYLIVFLGLLGWQIYNGFVMDATVWSYDDSAYVTYAADAIRYNKIQAIMPYTGLATVLDATRALQGWLYFPAFLSQITVIPVAVMERTILETFNIFLAYSVYAYMASVICIKLENGLLFLIILSLLYIFGWYSQYSVTFRLLGPNYQGKAILAVSFLPLLFTLLIQMLERKYKTKCGALLMLLSAAASSFSLFGTVTMVLNSSMVLALSSLQKERRRRNHLRYILWCTSLPAIYIGIYFVYKYAEF